MKIFLRYLLQMKFIYCLFSITSLLLLITSSVHCSDDSKDNYTDDLEATYTSYLLELETKRSDDFLIKTLKETLDIYTNLATIKVYEEFMGEFNLFFDLEDIMYYESLEREIIKYIEVVLKKYNLSLKESTCLRHYKEYKLAKFYNDYVALWLSSKKQYENNKDQLENVTENFHDLMINNFLQLVKDLYFFSNAEFEILLNQSSGGRDLLKLLQDELIEVEIIDFFIDENLPVKALSLKNKKESFLCVECPLKYIFNEDVKFYKGWYNSELKAKNVEIIKNNTEKLIDLVLSNFITKHNDTIVCILLPSKWHFLDLGWVKIAHYHKCGPFFKLCSFMDMGFDVELRASYSIESICLYYYIFKEIDVNYDESISKLKSENIIRVNLSN